MPHDLITQLLRVLAIETKQEKAIISAEPTELTLSGLEAFSFDYIVKWPLSLIINRLGINPLREKQACTLTRGFPCQNQAFLKPGEWEKCTFWYPWLQTQRIQAVATATGYFAFN